MPRAVIQASPRLADLLRRRRLALGLSLREAAARTTQNGADISYSVIAKIEAAQVEPGIYRLSALLRAYDLPLSVVHDLVLADGLHQATASIAQDAAGLVAEGKKQARLGHRRNLLALVAASYELPEEGAEALLAKQRVTVEFARSLNQVGEAGLALRLLDQVFEDRPPDPVLVFDAFLAAAESWWLLDVVIAAEGFLEVAVARKDELDAARGGLSQRALVSALLVDHWPEEAAVIAQQLTETQPTRAEGLVRLAQSKAVAGDVGGALQTLVDLSQDAGRRDDGELMAWSRTIEARIRSQRGDMARASAAAAEASAAADRHGDPHLRLIAKYAAWEAANLAEDRLRTHQLRRELQRLVGMVDAIDEETIAVRRWCGSRDEPLPLERRSVPRVPRAKRG